MKFISNTVESWLSIFFSKPSVTEVDIKPPFTPAGIYVICIHYLGEIKMVDCTYGMSKSKKL